MENKKLVSVVIPCINEEKNINRLFDQIMDVMKNHKYNHEIIAVNDGSSDNTWEVIKEYSNRFDQIKGINLMGNFGQTAAYMAGFDKAKGDYVITFNADLELPTNNMLKVIDLLDEGYDFVNTNRTGRWGNDADDNTRSAKSGLANKILTKISGVQMKDRGSGLKGYRRILIENLRLYGEMHRFIPDLLTVYNAKMIEFDVEFVDRDYGQSYYKGHKRTIKVLLDLITLTFLLSFAKKPFLMKPGRLFGFTGSILAGLGGAGWVYLTIIKVFFGQPIGTRPLLLLSTLLIIVGIQSVMLGLLGELMVRIYFESSDRKTYVVREFV